MGPGRIGRGRKLSHVDGSGVVVHLLHTTTGDHCPHSGRHRPQEPTVDHDHQSPENPPQNPLGSPWGSISAHDMARVQSVDTHSKILAGGRIECAVIAVYKTPPGSQFEFARETVFTASSIVAGQKAAKLFEQACAMLAQILPPEGVEPGPDDSPPGSRQPSPVAPRNITAQAA